MDVLFDVSFDGKKLRRHVKRVELCECVAAEKTFDTLSREGFQKEKLREAGRDPNASAFPHKKSISDVLRKQMLFAASDTSF